VKDTIVRALVMDADGTPTDSDGRTIGEDWPVLHVPPTGDGDTDTDEWLTTDHVRASEYGYIVPGTQPGLARLLAVAVNKLWADCPSPRDWSALVHSCDSDDVLDGTDWPGWASQQQPPDGGKE
jgi:hypothetical protein